MRSWRMLCASATACGAIAFAAVPASAQTNQSGLVNVNVSNVYVQAPVNVQVPVGVAADVCNVDAAVLAQQATGAAPCTAQSTSTALNQAMTQQMVAGGGGGGANQSGLVNVNVSGLAVQLPVNVQVPVGIAANVCNVNAAVLAQQAAGAAPCRAQSTSTALNDAVARQLIFA